jgi:hypothetical protein
LLNRVGKSKIFPGSGADLNFAIVQEFLSGGDLEDGLATRADILEVAKLFAKNHRVSRFVFKTVNNCNFPKEIIRRDKYETRLLLRRLALEYESFW